MPKVSVVIPTYNRAQFLSEAVQSVMSQSFKDFETIVVDDGSTDNTREILASLPVRYIRQENRGVSAAINRGIEASSGDYVVFLASDDVLLETTLQKEVEILDSYPEVGFCYGQAQYIDENGSIFRVRKSSFLDGSTIVDGKEQIRELLFLCRITQSSSMVRRSRIAEVGGMHEELTFAEDRHFFIRLAKTCSAAYIAEPLVKYRVHSGQLHRKVDYRAAEKVFLLVLKEVYEDPNFAPYFQDCKNRAYCYSYRRIASYAYGNNMRLARDYLRKALAIYPQILLERPGLAIAYRYATSLLPRRLWLGLRELKWHLQDTQESLRE